MRHTIPATIFSSRARDNFVRNLDYKSLDLLFFFKHAAPPMSENIGKFKTPDFKPIEVPADFDRVVTADDKRSVLRGVVGVFLRQDQNPGSKIPEKSKNLNDRAILAVATVLGIGATGLRNAFRTFGFSVKMESGFIGISDIIPVKMRSCEEEKNRWAGIMAHIDNESIKVDADMNDILDSMSKLDSTSPKYSRLSMAMGHASMKIDLISEIKSDLLALAKLEAENGGIDPLAGLTTEKELDEIVKSATPKLDEIKQRNRKLKGELVAKAAADFKEKLAESGKDKDSEEATKINDVLIKDLMNAIIALEKEEAEASFVINAARHAKNFFEWCSRI
jgi:hypothetical protein